ncbi:thioesterase domain-containing protein [Streptomyces sp. NBC_01298]|nr:thioesterase domain-containing protein [Streptomyces sp. NBC_01298]
MRERWMLQHSAPDGVSTAYVYTIPSPGSGAASHRDLAQGAPADLSLITVRLPGRESRFSEPLLLDMEAVVAECVENIGRHARDHSKPFLLLGDCSGAFIAYEVARRLERDGPASAGLGVLGQVAPGAWDTSSPMADLPGDRFRTALLEAEIVSADIAASPDRFAFFTPVLRADLRVVELYEWKPEPAPGFPVVVFVDKDADATEQENMRAWTGATRGMVEIVLFPEAEAGRVEVIGAELARLLSVSGC